MKKEVNFYLIEDQHGMEKVMANTIDAAIAAFREYRKEQGKDEPRIIQIGAQLGAAIIVTED